MSGAGEVDTVRMGSCGIPGVRRTQEAARGAVAGQPRRPCFVAHKLLEPEVSYPDRENTEAKWKRYPFKADKKETMEQLAVRREVCFHGTYAYGVWGILQAERVLESYDEEAGHENTTPGAYTSPYFSTARGYARPANLFLDGVYLRFVFELGGDLDFRKTVKKSGGLQWVFAQEGLRIYALWVGSNMPPGRGEERVDHYDPSCEVIPPGLVMPPQLVNSRKTGWPILRDDEDSDIDEGFRLLKEAGEVSPLMIQAIQPVAQK